MYYVFIDPPVGPFSPPEEIRVWIDEFKSRESREEFQYPEGRESLDLALAEAEGWLERSSERSRSAVRQPPDRPAV
jgi:hypothetical protein